MKLYQACINLEIWHMAKARSEIWAMTGGNIRSLDNFKVVAKSKFRELAAKYHPDKGGNNEDYVKIREAYDIIRQAGIKQFIQTLKDEVNDNKIYYKPGDSGCDDCRKWSCLINSCVTTSCTGFDLINRKKRYGASNYQQEATYNGEHNANA